MKIILATALILAPALAFAQSPPPDASQDLQSDWPSLLTQFRHVGTDMENLMKENQTLRAENAKLKADAAAKAEPTKPAPTPTPASGAAK